MGPVRYTKFRIFPRACIRDRRPRGVSVQRGCELTGVARSPCYAGPGGTPGEVEIVAAIRNIADVFEGHGDRRVDAVLRHRGFVVTPTKMRRLVREHDLNPRRHQRFVRTTDSDPDAPIHPFAPRQSGVHGSDRLRGEAGQRTFQWKDRPPTALTCVAIAAGFACVALIMVASSRRAVGHAIGHRVDARLVVEAPGVAIALRHRLPGCVFHSDRGSQGASDLPRNPPKDHGMIGSMSRRANPHDHPQAERLVTTLTVENVYPMQHATSEEVSVGVPRFIDACTERHLHSASG